MIGNFHLIRPAMLLLLIPLGVLVWLLRRRSDPGADWRGIIAPHLLSHLLSRKRERGSSIPLWLMGAGSVLAIVAVAGPTWRPEPSPFADDTAPLAIVVKVTPSMSTEDVQPSRLACAVNKIHELLQLRRGGKTALIAYAGTAHRVMPETTDGGIIDTFAQALDPKIMPSDGDAAAAALKLAEESLAGAGSVLWFTDGVAPEQSPALAAWREHSRVPIRLLPPLLPGQELEVLKQSAQPADATIIVLTADNSDVASVSRAAKFATADTPERSERWQESGYWFTPLLACALLPFFRRGWMIPFAARAR